MPSRSPLARAIRQLFAAGLLPGVLVLSVPAACQRGGGGSGNASLSNQALDLVAIRFPDPSGRARTTVGTDPADESLPPDNASLVQQVVFEFSSPPDPGEISVHSLWIRDGDDNPVVGTYSVESHEVTFTPRLPTRNPSRLTDGSWDTGGAGLLPAASYSVRTGPRRFPRLRSIAPSLRARYPDPSDPGGVVIGFQTTPRFADLLLGLSPTAPGLISTWPADGAVGITPRLYRDPDDLFPETRPFELVFDAPLWPKETNLSTDLFQLIDLDDQQIALGVEIRIATNQLDRCVVEIMPSGPLPFGHLLALEYPLELRGLSERPDPGPGTELAATFTIAEVPDGIDTIHDLLIEDFHTRDGMNADPDEVAFGSIPARWDHNDSNLLIAASPFENAGLLGPFQPAPNADGSLRRVFLDTDLQHFPTSNGATPLAPEIDVAGGTFHFTDITIPAGVRLVPTGSHPLVLTATGTVVIAGEIEANGADGASDNLFDSAVFPVSGGQGGAGGGRGGDGHPIRYKNSIAAGFLSLVSPATGGPGWGPGNLATTGGQGGQSGHRDSADASGALGTDNEIDCNELTTHHMNNCKVPGGGGGSYLTRGRATHLPLNPSRPPVFGFGNVITDGLGNYVARTVANLQPGEPGLGVFQDADPGNDFIGFRGEVRQIMGGQGGGGGASALDSYFCGFWCREDSDPSNDNVCSSREFPSLGLAGSVGDSRGGGGGGGGGAVMIKAQGPIRVASTGSILCNGGAGGGGEQRTCSNYGGAGASGSGGAIVLESAESVTIFNRALLSVRGGPWRLAGESNRPLGQCDLSHNPALDDFARGDGGAGGDGIIQLQSPFGTTANLGSPASLEPFSSWLDPENTLNPSQFTSTSMAVSRWIDLGRTILRPPLGSAPHYRFLLNGREVLPGDDGVVQTDASGQVIEPLLTDIRCGFLGILDPVTRRYIEPPRTDFIPSNAAIRIEFQGASAVAPGSLEVDPTAMTAWSASPAVADGRQFLRYRIHFDIAADGHPLSPEARLPIVQEIKVTAEF